MYKDIVNDFTKAKRVKTGIKWGMMMDVYERILQEIHGKPQLFINERRVFLNAIYERVVVALTLEQLNSQTVYHDLFEEMVKEKDVHLWINGSAAYKEYQFYIDAALEAGLPFTVVHNKKGSPFGAVLATTSTPSGKGNPFIEDEHFHLNVEDLQEV